MLTRRAEALRRLGGPVCPVCDTVGADGVEVRFMTTDGSMWLAERGKQAFEREGLVPMCRNCFLVMNYTVTAKRMAAAERLAMAEAQAAMDMARLGRMDGQKYRQACAEHENDLAAAEEIAASWGIGNGLFGSRGE